MCKKIRKSFKTSELKAQVDSQKEAWKREEMYVSVGKGTLLPYRKVAQKEKFSKCC